MLVDIDDVVNFVSENYDIAKKNKENKIYEHFFREISQDYDICIFGAGNLGKQVGLWLIENNIIPKYYCDNDNNKVGNIVLNNIKCISFEELLKFKGEVYIIVAVADGKQKYNKIVNTQLSDFKNIFRNPLSIVAYWVQDFEMTKQDVCSRIKETYDMLQDDESKNIYCTLCKIRFSNGIVDYEDNELEKYYREPIYIEKNIVDYLKINSYIDVGAYNGDSLANFVVVSPNAYFYLFEMDNKIFSELVSNINTNFDALKEKICLYRGAVSSRSGKMNYGCDKTGTGSSRLVDYENENVTQVYALDDIDFDKKIDFIKMDIEGEEQNALKGAAGLIKKDHPILAISMYHNNSQFLEIPQIIMEIEPRYRIYIRQHRYTADDTVCYAVYK